MANPLNQLQANHPVGMGWEPTKSSRPPETGEFLGFYPDGSIRIIRRAYVRSHQADDVTAPSYWRPLPR